MAKLDKTALAVWRGGTAFDVTAGSGHTVLADGESEAGQSPMELVLSALVGCTGADVISILTKKRQAVTSMAVRVHGQRREAHPRCYTRLELTFVVTGRHVDPEAVQRAIELSETKYCSVSAMLKPAVELVIGYEIHEAESEPAESRPKGEH